MTTSRDHPQASTAPCGPCDGYWRFDLFMRGRRAQAPRNARQRDQRGASLPSGSHLLHHRLRAEDRHDAPEVVCEDMKAHLGADMLARFHEEVRGAHPDFSVPNGGAAESR